jgi:hypothetical protein
MKTSELYSCEVMYLLGRTVKNLLGENSIPVENDSAGKPILDRELYCITAKGIFPVE